MASRTSIAGQVYRFVNSPCVSVFALAVFIMVISASANLTCSFALPSRPEIWVHPGVNHIVMRAASYFQDIMLTQPCKHFVFSLIAHYSLHTSDGSYCVVSQLWSSDFPSPVDSTKERKLFLQHGHTNSFRFRQVRKARLSPAVHTRPIMLADQVCLTGPFWPIVSHRS